MKLYVANCTVFNYEFNYVVPETGRPRKASIPAGKQVQVHVDSDQKTLGAIVEQGEIYGFLPVSEIPRSKKFIGLCFSYDKPIDVDAIMTANEGNAEKLDDVARQVRMITAAAIADRLTNMDSPVTVSGIETEVQDVPRQGDTQKFHEGVFLATEDGFEARARRGR